MPLDVGRVSHLLEQMHRSEDDAGDPIVVDKVLVTDGDRGFTWEDYGGSSGGTGSAVTVETQNIQSRRYLMQDGTWRDPLTVGLGTVTAGSPSTVTDDTKYNAWPNICRLTEDRVMLAYTKADSHHGDNGGKAVVRIGTESDGAISWGSEITAYDDPSLWSSQIGVQRISTGRVFMTLFRDNFSSSGTGEAGIVYSDDSGATWTDWIDLTNGFTQESYGAGAVCEMPDGDLLVTIEGSNTGQSIADRSSHTLRSTDEGVTWGGEVTVRNYVTDSRPYYESSLLLLDNDVLQCYHRTSGGSPGTHYVSTSTDFGFTWGAPVAIVSGYGKPNVIQASSGTVFLVTRQNTTADTILFTSIDRGITWDSGTVIATVTEMEYGAPVESLTAGDIYIVWGDEVSSSNTDIDVATVREDVTTFAGVTLSDDTPLIEAGAGDPGVSTEASRSDHVHPEFGSSSGVGEILIADSHSTPLVFADLLQNEAGSDLLYDS